jgi:hypothetical protein
MACGEPACPELAERVETVEPPFAHCPSNQGNLNLTRFQALRFQALGRQIVGLYPMGRRLNAAYYPAHKTTCLSQQ